MDGWKPLTEDDFWWGTTFDGPFDQTQLLMVYYIWWEMTFDGRQPLMEDEFWWKGTFDGVKFSKIEVRFKDLMKFDTEDPSPV